MNENLFEVLKSGFPADLSSPFLIGERTISYQYMLERSAQYANALIALGVAPGDRVAVQVEKSGEALMLYLGAIRSGAVYLPLNTAYTPNELSYFLGDAEPSLVVCAVESKEALLGVAGDARVETLRNGREGSILSHVDAAPTSFEEVVSGAESLAAILYTSGTTGLAKGAMLSHRNLSSNARALAETWRFTSNDCLLHALPVYHTHGLFTATNTILHAGAAMLFLPKFDIDKVMEVMPEATSMMGVPTFYSRLLQDERLTRENVKHIRVFISGSAPLSPEIHSQFETRTGHAILERYGMSETGMNTSNPYQGERRAGTVGFPLPGVELRISDPKTGDELMQGEPGSIELRGPNVFEGYWRKPEKTHETFRDDGFFITGDLGLIDEQGYVNIVGRDKDLIITGGFNVYPAEVEAAIDAIEGVGESAVIGAPHADFGEGVVAVVAGNPDQDLSEEDILKPLNGVLARFKQPKRVFFLDALPRNAMGKVQKKELRDQYAETFKASDK